MIDYLETLLDGDGIQWAEEFELGAAEGYRGWKQTAGSGTTEGVEQLTSETAEHSLANFNGLREAMTDREEKIPEGIGALSRKKWKLPRETGVVASARAEDETHLDTLATMAWRMNQQVAVERDITPERMTFATGVLEQLGGGGPGAAALYQQMRGRMGEAAYVRRETPVRIVPLTAEGGATGVSADTLDRLCERDARRYDGGFELF